MRLLWIFFLYSFLGFGLELLFAWLTHSDKPDRKCLLFLPLCPVYGLGAILILSLPGWIQQSPLLLPLFASLAATAVEYAMSLFYEYVWKVHFWDYTDLPWNIHGRVCLPFSLCWAALSFPIVAWIQPVADQVISTLPDLLLLPLLLLFLADSLLTGSLLRQSQDTHVLVWYK